MKAKIVKDILLIGHSFIYLAALASLYWQIPGLYSFWRINFWILSSPLFFKSFRKTFQHFFFRPSSMKKLRNLIAKIFLGFVDYFIKFSRALWRKRTDPSSIETFVW